MKKSTDLSVTVTGLFKGSACGRRRGLPSQHAQEEVRASNLHGPVGSRPTV